ncbi:MAG TPA: M14 family metallopeptidase [Saprospiraceae bacterium]|nr:M14 family metallopeptidase [Saprospiraceae bacterium]
MMLRTFCMFICICLTLSVTSQNTLQSPLQYFSHYGKQHTFHHQVLEYVKHIDEKSEMVMMKKFGETYQGRPLNLIFVSSPENIKNLEDIRLTNLYNSGVTTTKPSNINEKALVWCSFGVHGNEAGTTETVPNFIYQLIAGKDQNTKDWLKNAVVIIDPSLNPDGYDRYVHFLKSVSGVNENPNLSHREHMEPWPTGRYNHYMFDMNRDWAWQTQKESRERISAYNQWLPHIHADFHEMGANANYYFAPAAQPYHKFMSPFQKDFHVEIGKNHASYFDKNGWLYWTREVFDLFYPSYGDTYPTYSGAIGMTYEQAGNSSSGRTIQLENGDTLTIQEKIDHNTVVALSTIEISSKNAEKIISNFKNYYAESIKNPNGKYKTYVLKSSPGIQRLATLFDRSGIQYGYATQNSKSTAYHYQTKSSKVFDIQEGDMIVQASQPRSVLLQVLMEEEPALSDSLTYDITSWALPFAYGIDCYAYTTAFKVDVSKTKTEKTVTRETSGAVFSIQIPWNDLTSAKALSDLYKKDYKVRMSVKESMYQGKVIPKGTLMVNKGDNKWKKVFETEIMTILSKHNISDYVRHTSGFSDKGGDLGGNYFQLIKAPKVLTFSGRGISANSCGEIWHYFDELLDYQVSIVEWDNFERADLSTFNTIILPDGYYRITDERFKALSEWTSKGGRLIVIDGALRNFSGKEGLTFETFATEDEKKAAEEEKLKQDLKDRLNDFEGLERRSISKSTGGAIIKNIVDDSHPLGYGLGKSYYSLKTSSSTYVTQKGMWNVIHIPTKYDSYGFLGSGIKKKLENAVSFAVQSHGNGQAIYMVDNPLFRSFWDKGLLLFSNAVFLNGGLPENY